MGMKPILFVLFIFVFFACQKDEIFDKKNRLFGNWRFIEYRQVSYLNDVITETKEETIEDTNIRITFFADQTYTASDPDEVVLWHFLKQFHGTWRILDSGKTLYFDLGVHEWTNDPQYGESSVYFTLKEITNSAMVWERKIHNDYADYSRTKITQITLTR